MTHEETSLKTKEMLAESLKKRMEEKPLGKITVSEIIRDCKVNRKTFYYHFEDIYDLLKWMLDRDAVEVIKSFDLLVDYEDALRFIVNYVESNAHILNCAFDSIGIEQLKRFFKKDFTELTMKTILEAETQKNIRLDDETRKFICNFLMEGATGLIIRDIKHRDHSNKEQTIRHVCNVIKTIPDLLECISKSENSSR